VSTPLPVAIRVVHAEEGTRYLLPWRPWAGHGHLLGQAAWAAGRLVVPSLAIVVAVVLYLLYRAMAHTRAQGLPDVPVRSMPRPTPGPAAGAEPLTRPEVR
jgi:hypothetical protein